MGAVLSKIEQIYLVTITNWEKHQKNKKKNHRSFLLENRFFNDDKIASLSAIETRLYLYLLTIAADLHQSSFAMHSRLVPNYFRIGEQSLSDCLLKFERIQLITLQKSDSNRIEKNRKEENRKENKYQAPKKIEPEKKLLNSEIWESYKDAYFERYGVEPVRNASTNSKISQLASRLGTEAIQVVKFYLKHNESWYLKNTHEIGACLKDCESLRTQMVRDQPITSSLVRQFEKESAKNDHEMQVERMFLDDDPK